MTYLDLSAISMRYGDNVILDGIDLAVAQGEMHVLLGPSGCGKTTLLRSIAGLVQPDKGSIHLAGRAIEKLHPKDRGIGMVFQHYALFPNMTVRQNLAFGLEQRRLARKAINDKIDAVLEIVSLQDKADASPRQLSGGQKQRVALARALVLEPSLLLLDEPLSALDAQIRKRLRDELKRIQRRTGLTSILVTHDQDEALSLGDRISVMNKGGIEHTADGSDIFYRPATLFVAQFIGHANILNAEEFSSLTARNADLTAVIHPHAFRSQIPLGRTDGINLRATILEAVPAGSIVRYSARVNGVIVSVEEQTAMDTRPHQVGEEIELNLRLSDIHFLSC